MESRRETQPLFLLDPKTSRNSHFFLGIISLTTVLEVFLWMSINNYDPHTIRATRPLPARCQCQSQRPLLFAEPQAFHVMSIELSNRSRPCAMAYSAFYDHRDRSVKVVTDSDLSCFRSVSVTCQLWYLNARRPFLSDLAFDYHLLANEKTERADRLGAVYTCHVSSSIKDLPYAVSFYSQRDECKCHPTLSMEIHYPQATPRKFSVCVPALYGSLSVKDLVGFIEFHRLLGAEKFYFYNESVSSDVVRLLESYSQQGVVESIRWQPPFPSRQIYHDQQVMQLDCSLRNLRQSDWVAQLDVDELLLPTDGVTWSRMVDTYGRNDTGAFLFLNRFYAKDESAVCTNVTASNVTGYDLAVQEQRILAWNQWVPIYLRRLRYYDRAFGPGTRSKILYRTEATAQARTHVALLRPGYKSVVLSYDQAANRHYRNSPLYSSDKKVLDRSSCIHEAALMHSVLQAAVSIFQSAN